MSFIPYKKYKTIAHNTAYLSVLEVLKLVMPFVALPYIIKTIGGSNYGLVVFAQTIISYFIIFVNFGLDVSAVKEVSVNRENRAKLSEVVSSVLIIKFILFVLAFLILTILILSVERFRQNQGLYYLSFLACLSEILFPIWFYQGVEKMKYITLIRFTSILFYTVSVFLFIKSPADYYYIPLLQSIGWLLSGAISFYMLIRVERIVLFVPKVQKIRKYFIESTPFFISRISVVINSSLAKTICGFLFSMQVVAAFDLAQKIATTAFVPLQMMNQALFPHIAKTRDTNFTSKCFNLILIVTGVIVVGVYFMAPFAVRVLSNGELTSAIPILQAFCLFIFSGGISLYTGSPLLVSFGYPKPFNRSVLLSTFVLMIVYLCLYIVGRFSIISFAYALGVAEFIIAMYRLYYCYHYKIIKLKWSI